MLGNMQNKNVSSWTFSHGIKKKSPESLSPEKTNVGPTGLNLWVSENHGKLGDFGPSPHVLWATGTFTPGLVMDGEVTFMASVQTSVPWQ